MVLNQNDRFILCILIIFAGGVLIGLDLRDCPPTELILSFLIQILILTIGLGFGSGKLLEGFKEWKRRWDA